MPPSHHDHVYSTPGLPPFESHQLDERLLAGRNPLTREDVEALRRAGVTQVLDLRQEQEWTAPGRFGASAVEACEDLGIERFHVPVRDTGDPSDGDLSTAVEVIERAVRTDGARVYVHCRAGRERTAAILAAYLCTREGFTLDQARRWLRRAYGARALPGQDRAVERFVDGRRENQDDVYRSRTLGCLLAGAVGDALGAAIEFDSLASIRRRFGPQGVRGYEEAYGRRGAITDDTQMTLFTAEGLIRSSVRWHQRGLCHPPSMVRFAYLRWLTTQQPNHTVEAFDGALTSGWLVHEKGLHARRAPGNTCLSGLLSGRFGSPTEPLNDSKGCGGVMRAAPAGLVRAWEPEEVFDQGCEYAALTHGHPTGWLAAGALAHIVRQLMDGIQLADAARAALATLSRRERHEETTSAIEAALELAAEGAPSAEKVESLGAGWIAEEALSIALYAALTAEDLRHGLLLAVNHSGDSDSTGSIAGNLLGAMHGVEAIPGDLLGELELRRVITTVAEDCVREFSRESFRDDAAWWDRYPGW